MLVERCQEQSTVSLDDKPVDLTEACQVLASWDGRYDLESRGAVVFREFIGQYPSRNLLRKGSLFDVDFDPADPVGTPRGLAEGDVALQNLARAVERLQSLDIPLDVPLGELQYADKGAAAFPCTAARVGTRACSTRSATA